MIFSIVFWLIEKGKEKYSFFHSFCNAYLLSDTILYIPSPSLPEIIGLYSRRRDERSNAIVMERKASHLVRFVLINFSDPTEGGGGGDKRQNCSCRERGKAELSVLVAGRQAGRQEFHGNNPSWKRNEKNGKGRAIIGLRARTIQGRGREGKCNSGTRSFPSPPRRNSLLEISLGSHRAQLCIRIPWLFRVCYVEDIQKRK